MSTLLAETAGPCRPAPEPYLDAPTARDFVLALGRVYLEAGLPLAAAIDAALADYHGFGAPTECGS